MNRYGCAVLVVFIAFAEVSVSSGQTVSEYTLKVLKKIDIKLNFSSQQRLQIKLSKLRHRIKNFSQRVLHCSTLCSM